MHTIDTQCQILWRIMKKWASEEKSSYRMGHWRGRNIISYHVISTPFLSLHCSINLQVYWIDEILFEMIPKRFRVLKIYIIFHGSWRSCVEILTSMVLRECEQKNRQRTQSTCRLRSCRSRSCVVVVYDKLSSWLFVYHWNVGLAPFLLACFVSCYQ